MIALTTSTKKTRVWRIPQADQLLAQTVAIGFDCGHLGIGGWDGVDMEHFR